MNGNKGFTLLEILVAIVLLAVSIATASSSLRQYMRTNYRAEAQSEASHAAQSVIDGLRYNDIKTLPNSGTLAYASKTMDDDRVYTVNVSFCELAEYCTSNAVRHLAVDVEFQNEVLYSTETVFTDLGTTSGGTGPTPNSSVPTSPSQSPSAAASPSRSPSPSPSVSAQPSPSPSSTSTRPRRCKWWWC